MTNLVNRPAKILDPGLCLTLRPMAYPVFFEMYRDGIRNAWTVEEVDFATDVGDLQTKMTDAERHLVKRLVAFFATGDSIVANNVVLSLYKHLNAPEARMYLSRQLYEEALHVQFYLTLLDTYVPDPARAARGLRGGREHSVDQAEGGVLHALARQRAGAAAAGDAGAPAAVPAEPDLLRRLRRGAVLLRRVRLRLLPALARPLARPGRRDQLGLPRRERAHGVRLRGGANDPRARSRSCSTPSSRPRSRR